MIVFLLYLLCGVFCINALSQQFIFNGTDAEQPIPFYAYVEITNGTATPPYNLLFGGGALVSLNIVVTVAQNVYDSSLTSWRVGLGAIIIANMRWSTVAEAVYHPNYNPNTLINNIARLRLTEPIVVSPTINPISLLPTGIGIPFEGFVGYVAGFGLTEFQENATQAHNLQYASLTVTSPSTCVDRYPHIRNDIENFFCASNNETNANICGGDQGGPFYGGDIYLFLFGISSFNRAADCSHVDSTPAAFVRVSEYSAFING